MEHRNTLKAAFGLPSSVDRRFHACHKSGTLCHAGVTHVTIVASCAGSLECADREHLSIADLSFRYMHAHSRWLELLGVRRRRRPDRLANMALVTSTIIQSTIDTLRVSMSPQKAALNRKPLKRSYWRESLELPICITEGSICKTIGYDSFTVLVEREGESRAES